MVRLSVDFEFASRSWWDQGGQDLWDGLTGGLDGDANSVTVDEHMAKSWLAQAEKIPGWNEGADYAPHPITVSAVEDDDPDLL